MITKNRSHLLLGIACGVRYDMSDMHFLDFLDPSKDDLTMMLITAVEDVSFLWLDRCMHQSTMGEERLLHMKTLIHRGANVNGSSVWPLGVIATPLTMATMSHRPEAVHLLLEHAADINKVAEDPVVPFTPLQSFLAANSRDSLQSKEATELLELLLRSRADPNVEASPSAPFSCLTCVPLWGGPPEFIEMLVQSGQM